MKGAVPKVLPIGGGGAQWAIPQVDAERWLADSSFATGSDPFRAAMRHHAKGVAVITAGVENPVGFCATSLSSVSLDPPIVSFTVGLRSSSWETVATARHVVAHLLADGQQDLARRFAQQDTPRFGPDTRWHRGVLDLPVLDDALAWLVLTLVSHLPVGDHALVVGRVAGARQATAGEPLIHHKGGFARLVTD
jgi:flavin reductase (DIM6/NTAB) family NADH-FMN oxidoreductase RutF